MLEELVLHLPHLIRVPGFGRRIATWRWPRSPGPGFDPVYGARPLKRAIQAQIENPVARLVLEGKVGLKDVVPVDFREGRFTFERTVH